MAEDYFQEKVPTFQGFVDSVEKGVRNAQVLKAGVQTGFEAYNAFQSARKMFSQGVLENFLKASSNDNAEKARGALRTFQSTMNKDNLADQKLLETAKSSLSEEGLSTRQTKFDSFNSMNLDAPQVLSKTQELMSTLENKSALPSISETNEKLSSIIQSAGITDKLTAKDFAKKVGLNNSKSIEVAKQTAEVNKSITDLNIVSKKRNSLDKIVTKKKIINKLKKFANSFILPAVMRIKARIATINHRYNSGAKK